VEDAAAYDVALEAPCVVATGNDASLRAIATRLDGRQRLVGYGHRFSIGVVGPDLATRPAALDAAARGLALDVARWDQSGCLSPVAIYLVDLPRAAQERFAQALSERLDALAATMPRGELAPAAAIRFAEELAAARMRAGTDGASVYPGTAHAVVLEADARPCPAPLGRFLRLHPVPSAPELSRALRPFSGHLATVALAGFPGEDTAPAADRQGGSETTHSAMLDRLLEAGVSRITQPGSLQTPPVDWPRDGLPLFLPLARFASADPAGA
jgi:hypothetical protein